jgi:hypothetical protein
MSGFETKRWLGLPQAKTQVLSFRSNICLLPSSFRQKFTEAALTSELLIRTYDFLGIVAINLSFSA